MPAPVTAPSPTRHRWLLLAGALLCLLASAPLLLAPGSTATLFAFGVRSPLTAVLLGACELAGAVALAAAWRERAWGGAVVIGPGVFAASSLTLAVSLMEAGRLHLAAPGLARLAAWAWLAAALVAPPGWLFLAFANDLAWSADPVERPLLPRALLNLVGVEAAVLALAGAWLFVAPAGAPWPWTLGAPADRLLGGWLVAFGLTGAAILVERDEGRCRAALGGGLAFSAVALLAVAILRHELRPGWPAVALVAFLGALFVTSLAGVLRGVRDRRPRAAPFVR